MTTPSGRWAEMDRLLVEALDRPKGERASFLTSACGEDAELRESIERLLQEADKIDPALEPGAVLQGPLWNEFVADSEGKENESGGAASARLAPGDRLASYEILSLEGVGGMGEVYRAKDTELGREVAIKVLPESFAHDSEHAARFEREARALASLNHPNIATLYGAETAGDHRFLVMELVEGDTLAERLTKGAIPVDDALPIFVQMAQGLEAAHDEGIVHRDLKPANVKITPEGRVKILDFGIAKAPTIAGEAETTLTPSTATGVAIGTFAYMSPEQARGRRVDKRTDIWAFGCVLYEALAGSRAFEGESSSDLAASVLTREPDWTRIPSLPPAIERLLRRCLRKDVDRRLHDIADARIEIEEARTESGRGGANVVTGEETLPSSTSPSGATELHDSPLPVLRTRVGLTVSAVVLVALGVLAGVVITTVREDAPTTTAGAGTAVRRFTLRLPADAAYPGGGNIAISPDGEHVVYIVVDYIQGTWHLYLRTLGDFEPRLLPGTERGIRPFFSPDGRSIAFISESDNRLMRVSLVGSSTPVALEGPEDVVGSGAWCPDGTIVFASGGTELHRMPDSGGVPEVLTRADPERGELQHRWPNVTPDGRLVVFTIWGDETKRIGVLSLKTGTWRSIVEGSYGFLTPTGHLVYQRSGTLMAAPFDPDTLELRGEEVPLIAALEFDPLAGDASFSFSRSGTLLYAESGYGAPADSGEGELLWVDLQGAIAPTGIPPGVLGAARISPDGERVAYDRDGDLWVFSLVGQTSWQLTSDPAVDYSPVWMPEQDRVLFASNRTPELLVYATSADGTGGVESLGWRGWPEEMSADGRRLLIRENHPGEGIVSDIVVAALNARSDVQPLLGNSTSRAYFPRLSPDGAWVAYESRPENGAPEVFVTSFPEPAMKLQISAGAGGHSPLWAPDGRRIFYRQGRRVLAIDFEPGPPPAVGEAELLFEGDFIRWREVPSWDITPDGSRFLMFQAAEGSTTSELLVVENWFEELKRLVPVN